MLCHTIFHIKGKFRKVLHWNMSDPMIASFKNLLKLDILAYLTSIINFESGQSLNFTGCVGGWGEGCWCGERVGALPSAHWGPGGVRLFWGRRICHNGLSQFKFWIALCYIIPSGFKVLIFADVSESITFFIVTEGQVAILPDDDWLTFLLPVSIKIVNQQDPRTFSHKQFDGIL